VALDLDGVQTGQALSSGTPSFTWDTTGVAPGPHTLTFVATDNAGNSSTSAGVVVDVANTGQAQYNTYAMRDLPDGTSAGANVASGNGLVIHQDFSIPNYGPDLALTRTYNSLGPTNNLFGWGWTSDFDEHVTANADGSVTYRDPDGGLQIFLSNGSGGYLSSPGLNLTLVKNADHTYTMTAHDQSQTIFTSTGYLWKLVDRNANTLRLAYNGATLQTVTDASGRTLQVTISGGHITQIVDPLSHTYTYGYDTSGNLTDYTTPDGIDTHYGYDTSHHVTQVIANCQTCSGSSYPTGWQFNVTSTLTYDSAGRLVKLLDPMGFDADFSYGVGQPGTLQTKVQQLQTNATTTPSSTNSVYQNTTYTMANDGSGAVTAILDPAGDQTYDPANGTTQYQYDANERVTQVTNQDGKVTAYTYDANGNELTRTVDPSGLALKTTWTYDSANNVLTETDPLNIETQYTYDSPTTGNLTKTIKNYVSGQGQDSQTNVTTLASYDSHGETLTATDALNVVTQYTYDTYGDLLQMVKNYISGAQASSTVNVATSATYNILGQELTSTDALGIVAQNTLDVMGNVLSTTQNYVSGGPVNDPNHTDTNVTTTTTYDALNRPWTTTSAPSQAFPNGTVTLTQYDADGRVIGTVANCTVVTGNNCYGLNKSVAQSGTITPDPVQQTNIATVTMYDAAGNATSQSDGKGNTTVTTHDGDNRAIEVKVTDKSNPNTPVSDKTTTYDAAGLVTATQVKDGQANPITTYFYDAAGRQVTQTDPPANPNAVPTDPGYVSNVTTTTYDNDGNQTEQVVTNANVSGDVSDDQMTYDKLGRTLTKVENANDANAKQTTSYTYDANGQQVTMIQPSDNGATATTQTTYDPLGRVATSTQNYGSTDPNNPPLTTTTTYDADGHTLSTSNPTGSTANGYDALGRTLTAATYNPSNVVQTSQATTYDTHGNALITTSSSLTNPSVTVTRSYDALDHLATMTDGQRSYIYDLNGNVTDMSVVDPTNNNAPITTAKYGYDGGDRLLSQIDNVAVSGTLQQLHTYTYSYDAHGDRNTASADGTTTTYTYDASHQLLSEAVGSTTTVSYTYDGYNNRHTMVTSAGTTTYTYNPTVAQCACHTELTSRTDPNGKVTNYTYDKSGNLTQAVYDPTGANQITTYGYDANNRLNSVTKPDGTVVTFTYDANEQRTATTVTPPAGGGSATTVKDYYAQGQLASQTDGANTLLATYTYDATGAPASVVVGSDPTGTTSPRYYYIYNAHGDVVNLVDKSGNVVASYAYDTWGNLTSSSESFANGWTNPYRYDGRDGVRYDASDGLYWMQVRAYDPTVGRFISHDPLGRAPLFFSDQPYVYAGNNPVSNVDPSGERYTPGNGGGDPHPKRHAPKSPRTRTKKGSPKKWKLQLHSVAVGKLSFTLHLSLMPSWWDWGDFAKATGIMIASLALIIVSMGFFATAEVDPINALLGVVALVNAMDAYVHAVAIIARDVCATCSLTRLMEATGAMLDAVALMLDVTTFILLTTPLEFGAAVAPLLDNTAAWTALATVTGIDFGAIIDDFKELIKG
jgi:RHS repeat-associated protein